MFTVKFVIYDRDTDIDNYYSYMCDAKETIYSCYTLHYTDVNNENDFIGSAVPDNVNPTIIIASIVTDIINKFCSDRKRLYEINVY